MSDIAADVSLVQGSAEWLAARAGSLGASQVADALARTKSGWGASRANLITQLMIERLTGQCAESYVNATMQWGVDTEPQARAHYEFETGAEVREVGLVRHPTIIGAHASPDGLVGDDGLLEIKCPTSATHIDTLLGGSVSGRYHTQVQWQLACTGRAWCDFVSYDPRVPAHLRLFVQRISRDNAAIAELEREVRGFLSELDAKIETLNGRYRSEAA